MEGRELTRSLPLTTIRTPTAGIGRVAAEPVLSMIDGAETPAAPISLQPRLVARGSTGAPRR